MTTYTMVYRGVKGSPLTNTEVDTNFQNLDTYKSPLDSPSFTTLVNVAGQLTAVSASGALIASNGGGTGQTSIQLKRLGAATDQKTYEMLSDSSGNFVVRSVNDAYSSNASIISATRGTTYTMATLSLMSSGGRVLVGSGSDDGVNALQVTGNIESDSKLVLTSATAGLEIGSTTGTGTPTIDLHSSGTAADYDVRLSSTGGSSSAGNGVLNANAGGYAFQLAGTGYLSIVSGGRTIIGGGTDDGASVLQLTGNLFVNSGFGTFARYGTSGAVRLRGAGGTSASPTAIGTGVTVGQLLFSGYDGTTYMDTAQVLAAAEATFTSTIAPTGLRFYTTGPATNVASEAMRLTGSNRLLINQTSDDLSHMLQVTGGAVVTSSGAITGMTVTGAANTNSALYLINTTASTGRSFSVVSGSGGNFSINDETAGTVARFVVMGGANRILLAGATDDLSTNVQVGGTFKTSGNAIIGGALNVNGGGINMTGAGQTSASFEMGGSSCTTSYIDFHSSATAADYDCRIISTGGNSTAGNGTLALYGSAVNFNATNVNLVGAGTYSALLVFKAGSYVPFMRGNSTISAIEFINSANTVANFTVYDNGSAVIRAGLTCAALTVNGSTICNNGSLQIQNFGGVANSGVVYFGTSGARYLYYNASTDNYNLSGARLDLSLAGHQLSLTYPGQAQWFPCVDGTGAYTVYNAGGAGVYVVNGGTAWAANSDERLKNIRSEITNAVEAVESIRTVRYSWKEDDDYNEAYGLEDDAKILVGVIAQDVEKVVPEAITHNGKGYLGVAYTDLVPVCMAAIKELSARVKELEAKLAEKE